MNKPYRITLDQGDSYVVVLPDGSERGTGYTAEGGVDHRAEREAAAERIYNEWRDGLRESDRKLFDALLEAGLTDLAGRASTGEWNDYFGKHAMNGHHLNAELKVRWAEAERDAFAGDGPPDRESLNGRIGTFAKLIHRIVDGDFDASKTEAEEWAASDEGQQIKDELGPELSKVIFGDGK